MEVKVDEVVNKEVDKNPTFLTYSQSRASSSKLLQVEGPENLVNVRSDFSFETVRNLNYLKDIFYKACIKALQSSHLGAWIHLLEVLFLLKGFSHYLLSSEQTTHYLVRLYDYCEHHEELHHLKIPQILSEMFPEINFEHVITKSISTLNSRSSDGVTVSALFKLNNLNVTVQKEPYLLDSHDLFKIKAYDLQSRIYEPKPLNILDLQKYLPKVVSDLSRLESTWENALGLTITSINTAIPEDNRGSPSPTFTTSTSYRSDLSKNSPFKRKRKTVEPKTGREVVESLVAASKRKEIQVWYLNVVPSIIYNPYNLVTVSKATIKKEHVVMSVFGVLHVRPNGDSELTPLGQWYMEAACFDTMKSISFFRNFQLIKVFRYWKLFKKYSQFLKLRRTLASLHLFNIPSVPKTLLNVQSLLFQSSKISLLPICQYGKLSIDSIQDFLVSHLVSQRKLLHKLFTALNLVLNKCHTDCVDYFNYCIAQLNMDMSDQESLAILQRRKDKQLKNKRTAEENLKKFDNIVCLVNEMVSSHLICKLSNEIESFIQTQILGNKDGCFYCKLETNGQTVFLSPTHEEISSAITYSLYDWLYELGHRYITKITLDTKKDAAVEARCNKISLTGLKNTLKESNVANGMKDEKTIKTRTKLDASYRNKPILDLKDSVLNNLSVLASFEQLKEGFDDAKRETDILLSSYAWLENILQFIYSWNPIEFEEKVWTLVSEAEKQIIELKSWQEHVSGMETYYVTENGLLYIDASQLQVELMPKLDNLFSEIVSILTQKLTTESDKILIDLNVYIKALTKTYTNVEEFADYYMYINSVQVKVPDLQQTVDKLKSVFDLIKHCHRQLTTEEESKEEKMWMIWESFQFALQNGNNLVTAQVPSFTEQLTKSIKENIQETNTLVLIATSGEFLDASKDPGTILPKLKEYYERFNAIFERIQVHVKCLETISGFKEEFEGLLNGRKQMHSRYELWKYLELSTQSIKEWNNTVFAKYQQNVNKIIQKKETWHVAAKTLKAELPANDNVYVRWISMIQDFSDDMEVMKKLANAILKDHHWRDIFLALGHAYNPSTDYRVSDILSMNIVENATKVYQICAAAAAEHALQQCLQALIKQWEKKNFKFRKNTSSMRNKPSSQAQNRSIFSFYILTGVDELICQLEDSLITLESMLVSPHVAEVQDLVGHWNSELQEIKEILDLWTIAQQQWVYLSQMFSNEATQENHSQGFSIYKEVSDVFKNLINVTMSDSKVLHILQKKRGEKGWREYQGDRLKELLSQLIEKQTFAAKSMDSFVATIQEEFPRLYFWSKEELLSLVTYVPNPPGLLPIVIKCFPNIVDLKFEMPADSKSSETIDVSLNLHLLETVAVRGEFDEMLWLDKPIPTNVSFSIWLNSFGKQVKSSFWLDVKNCIEGMKEAHGSQIAYNKWSDDNVHRKHTFQALLLFYDTVWTSHLERIKDRSITVNKVREKILKDVKSLTDFLCSTKLWTFSNKSDQRCLLLAQNLLLKALHFKDQLSDLRIEEEDSFDWLKLVKYNYKFSDDFQANDIKINCFGFDFNYGFEYLGPTEGLVYTPIADRSLVTILTALKQHHVGCVYGNTGSGKTKLVAEVGKILGCYTFILNCTENTTLECVEKAVHGSIRVGNLLCIDNINVMSQEMLSTIGDMLQRIHDAFQTTSTPEKTVGDTTGVSDGTVRCHPMYGCLVTSDHHFMEWKHIPDNLRAIFAPTSVKTPNTRYIFEVWFMLSGFKTSSMLAKKLALLYDVAKQSTDLSLAKISSIISRCGKMVQRDKVCPEMEIVQLAKALAASMKHNIAKEQGTVFAQQIQSVFTLTKDTFISCQPYNTFLVDSVKEQIKADNLDARPEFINKVLELQSLLSENQAVILYGPCASGKSTCYKSLSRALCQFHSPWSPQTDGAVGLQNEAFKKVNLKVVYPNALNADEIFGHFNTSTQTWMDGLLVKLLKQFTLWKDVERSQAFDHVQENICKDIQQWLILDGALNTNWMSEIEGLLDAYKTSVLTNGKRISLTKTCRVLFEVDSLSTCSPSLLSKCGWLYFPPDQIVDWSCLFYSWAKTMHSKLAISMRHFESLKEALSYTLEPTAQFIAQSCSTSEFHQDGGGTSCNVECIMVLDILSALLHHWLVKDQSSQHLQHSDDEFVKKFLCNALAYSFAYGLTPFVLPSQLPKVDLFIRQIFSTCQPLSVIFPAPCLECYFDAEIGELKPWNEQKALASIPLTSSGFVVTKEVQQCYNIVDMILSSKKNCLLLGDIGSGKSSFVKHLLTVKHSISKIQVSPAMSVEQLQKLLLTKINDIKSKQITTMNLRNLTNSTKSKKAEKILFFIDDLNDGCFGTDGVDINTEQPLCEFARQLVAEGGCYNLKGNNFHHLPHLQLIITSKHQQSNPNGRQSYLRSRFCRNFSIINYPSMNSNDWVSIFNRPCQAWFDTFEWLPWKHAFGKMVLGWLVNTHVTITKTVEPRVSPSYSFSQHHIARALKRMISFRSSGVDVEATQRMKDLSLVDFDYYFTAKQEFVDKSVSEQLIAPKAPVKEQVELLTKLSQQILQAVSQEIQLMYGTRLQSVSERLHFNEMLRYHLKEALGNVASPGMDSIPKEFVSQLMKEYDEAEESNKMKCFDYMATEPLAYHMQDMNEFRQKVLHGLEELNYPVVIVDDQFLLHIHNLYSALQTSSGHSLLISDKGHGRRKVVNIVSKMMKIDLYEISSEKECDSLATIKDACNSAALNGKPVLLNVYGNFPESIYQCIVSLLSDGFCPGLYEPSELSLICTQLLPGGHLINIRKSNNTSQLSDRFFQRVKNNLLIVVCLQKRLLPRFIDRFPTSIHKFHLVDYYTEYDEVSWAELASQWISKNMGPEPVDGAVLARILGSAHHSTKEHVEEAYTGDHIKNCVSPLKFFECLHVFSGMYRSIKTQAESRQKYLSNTMEKVKEARDDIQSTMSSISQLEPSLLKAKEEMMLEEKLMKEAQNDYLKMKKKSENQYQKIEKLKVPCQELKEETRQDFAQLSPLYQAAVHALSLLDYHTLEELKTFPAPPVGVIKVANMLCVLFGIQKGWDEAKALLRSDNIFQRLQCFDKDGISDTIYKKLTKFVNNPETQPDVVKTNNFAAGQLCLWLQAIHSYCTIYRLLQPKKNALKEAEEKIMKAEGKLCEMKLETSNMRDSLEQKILQYKEKMKTVKMLEKKQQVLTDCLEYLQKLLDAMSPFIKHWEKELDEIEKTLSLLSVTTLYIAICSGYLGMVASHDQKSLTTILREVISKEIDGDLLTDGMCSKLLIKYLSSEKEQNYWLRSIDHHDLALRTTLLNVKTAQQFGFKCWPLLFDPHNEAEKWVRTLERNYEARSNSSSLLLESDDNNVVVIDADSQNLEDILTKALVESTTVLIKNVECARRSVLLNNILSRDNIQGKLQSSKNIEIECSSKFKLYLATSLSLPGLLREELEIPLHRTVCFNLEPDNVGLCQKLLRTIISLETTDLETQYQRVLIDTQFLEDEEKNAYETVLEKIYSMEKPFVEDRELCEYISFQREHLWLVQERLLETKTFSDKILQQRNEYLTLALYSSKIYRILRKMERVHPLYNFNLSVVVDVLKNAIGKSASTKQVTTSGAARVEEIQNLFIKLLYNVVSRSVLLEHTSSFLVCSITERHPQKHTNDIDGFLDVLLNDYNIRQDIDTTWKPDWMDEQCWCNMNLLAKKPCFGNLMQSLRKRNEEWQEYFMLSTSLMSPPYLLPGLTMFEVAILWIAYDRKLLPDICNKLVLCYLGPDFLEVQPFDFSAATTAHAHWNTLIIIPDREDSLVKDPSQRIQEMAKSCNISNVRTISMGVHHTFNVVMETMENFSLNGGWLILQNCHLVTKWPKDFLRKIQKIQNADYPHDHFHLWMIVRDIKKLVIPETLARFCHVITWEPMKNGRNSVEYLYDVNEKNMLASFKREVMRNQKTFYSRNYKISSREYRTMEYLTNNFSKKNQDEKSVNNVIYSSQLANDFDVNLYFRDMDNDTIDENKKSQMINSQVEMLSKYCNRTKDVTSFASCQQIDEIIQKLCDLKEKCILPKRTRLDKPHIFHALHNESLAVEENLKSYLFELHQAKISIEENARLTARQESILRALYKDKIPQEWKAGGNLKTLTALFLYLNSKLVHFEELLCQVNDHPLTVNIDWFIEPSFLMNALRLEYIDVKEEWKEGWIAEVIKDPSSVHDSANIVLQNASIQFNNSPNKTVIPYIVVQPIDKRTPNKDDVLLPLFETTVNRLHRQIMTLVVSRDDFEKFCISSDSVALLQGANI